ncbi:MAG: hypothetical protein CK547_00465 [Chitinophagaceae bacterium]|nr:MAG: hypothetical protein CK547_00465 [Chitinophagaceae bacterium]
MFTATALIFLYRPGLLDNTDFSILFSELLKTNNAIGLNSNLFELEFTINYAYVNKDITIESFSNLINTKTNSLNQYTNKYYNLDFIDLLNKKR